MSLHHDISSQQQNTDCCDKPDHVSCWQNGDSGIGKQLNLGLNGQTRKTVEDSGIDCNNPAQEVSEEKIIQWPRDHGYDILAKNVATFCPCQKKKKIDGTGRRDFKTS